MNHTKVNVFLNFANMNVCTTKPLLFFSTIGQGKTGFMMGEGIWKWRLQEYAINLKWILFLILLLIYSEWFTRKYNPG